MVRRRGSAARIRFSNGVLVALAVVAASALTGCASQQLADEQLAVKSTNAPRARAMAKPAMIAHRQLRPTFEESDTAKPGPAQASHASVPDHEEKTASIPSDMASTVSPSTPDPRTVRALNCRDQMFKQYRPVRFGSNGNATAQRDYFDSCMRQADAVR